MQEISGQISSPIQYGLEWEPPQISGVLKTTFFLPILIYFITLQIFGYLVKQLLWINHLPLTRHRLQNLTVSLVHSCITGYCSLIFFITRPVIMLEDAIHWYSPVAAQLIYFSMAYFLYDAVDVMRNDSSCHALVILAHHIVVYSIFSVGMLSRKFLPYTYWALLIEINTDFRSFLHVRSIIRLINRDPQKDVHYKTVSLLAFLTFFVFRFGTLLWMMLFMIVNYGTFHSFYTYSSLSAELFFFIFSIFLLHHLLIEEGILKKQHFKNSRRTHALCGIFITVPFRIAIHKMLISK